VGVPRRLGDDQLGQGPPTASAPDQPKVASAWGFQMVTSPPASIEMNGLDCLDVSPAGTGTAGTSNTWLANVGATDQPDGICGPPVDHPDDHGTGHGKKHKKKQRKHRPDPCACMRHPKAF